MHTISVVNDDLVILRLTLSVKQTVNGIPAELAKYVPASAGWDIVGLHYTRSGKVEPYIV